MQSWRNYTQEICPPRQFYIVAPLKSGDHSLARENAGQRRCGPLPRVPARWRSSREDGGSSGFLFHQLPAVSQGAPVPCGLAKAASGPAAARCSGPRAGDRPVRGRRLRALTWIGGRASRLDGDGEPLRRCAVRHRKPGCPANSGSWREGAGRSSTLTFPARAASLPRVGGPADPGPRGFREEVARRFHYRPRPAPARAAVMAREAAREGSLSGDLEKTGGKLRAAARPDGILRDPARAPGAPRRPSARLALLQGYRGGVPERRSEAARPSPASSLPSGRSVFSLRRIGHARPGIRARKLIKNTPAAVIVVLSWIQLLRRRVVPSLPGHVAVGTTSLHPAPHSLQQPIPRFNQILWWR